MNIPHSQRRQDTVAVTLAAATSMAALLLLAGNARAAVTVVQPEATPQLTPPTMATCNGLPSSRKEFCKSEAGWGAVGGATVPIDQSASAKTASEMAACRTLPLSQRGICQAQAGYGQAVPEQKLSSSQTAALSRGR